MGGAVRGACRPRSFIGSAIPQHLLHCPLLGAGLCLWNLGEESKAAADALDTFRVQAEPGSLQTRELWRGGCCPLAFCGLSEEVMFNERDRELPAGAEGRTG